MFERISLVVFIWIICSCAQVPQSSVTLSNSIGEDITSMALAHKDFVNYYYDSLEEQANNFINNTYRTKLLSRVLEQDAKKFADKDENKKKKSMFYLVQTAFLNSDNLSGNDLEHKQGMATAVLKSLFKKIDLRVEAERAKLITPLQAQRNSLLDKVDENYANIQNKNAAISGLLNSVVEVHETQNKIFELAGIKYNVREAVGENLKGLSQTINNLQNKVDQGDASFDQIESALGQIEAAIKMESPKK